MNTKELEVQRFLRTGGTLEDLSEQFSISSNRHKTYPNLVLLKYSQIDSPMGNPIVQDSRGIILDQDNDWEVISWAFPKFFNSSEGHAAHIEWSRARVYSKLDGSICVLFSYKGQWHVATSGSPDASGELLVPGEDGRLISCGKTFKDLFWETFMKLGWELPEHSHDTCFAFEFTGPLNRIVVRYSEQDLHLIGVRNLEDLREEDPLDWALNMGWKAAPYYPITTLDEAVAAANALNPMQNEGYVICDMGNFNRIKLKNPRYVVLHHSKSNLTPKSMVTMLQSNEGDEFLSYFPEYRDLYDKFQKRMYALERGMEQWYQDIKHIEVQKEFALIALRSPLPASLFELRKGKVKSIKEFISKMRTEALLDLLECCP